MTWTYKNKVVTDIPEEFIISVVDDWMKEDDKS